MALCWIAACGPSDPLERARQMQGEGQVAASLEPLKELVDARPDDAEVHYRYALALIASDQISLAKWPLLRAMDSPEWLKPAGLAMAQIMLDQTRTEEAIRACDRVLEADPENTEALVLRAAAKVRTRRDYESALEDAERVLAIDPDNLAALVPKTAALLGLERVEEAAVALEALENVHRDDTLGLHGSPGLCAARAIFLWEKGDPDGAEERFEVCSEEFPGDSLILEQRIKFFDGTARKNDAEALLRAAMEEHPEAPHLRSALIDRLNREGRTEEVEALLLETTETSPELASSAWFSLALRQLERGDLEVASSSFEKALALDPSRSPELLFGYADGLVVVGKFDEARRVADSMRVPAHKLLVHGRIALVSGEPGEALEFFTRANQIWPDNAVARYYTATAAEQVGDFTRAVEDYRYSMRIDVKATDAYLRLARMQNAAGQGQAAIRTLGFQAGGRPSEDEATLLGLELMARADLEPSHAFKARSPGPGPAAAALARGLGARLGPEEGARYIEAAEGLDLGDPANADSLRVLIDSLAAAGEAAKAVAHAEAAVASAPESARFHALLGRARAAQGESPEAVREAYARAVELDPEQGLALAGLASQDEAAGELESALALYQRAVAADDDDRGPARAAAADDDDRESARAAAALLVRLERPSDAESVLVELLRDHPWDPEAAIALAELRLARGDAEASVRELARRALGFGGGEAANALARRVGVKRPALEDADLEADPGAPPSEAAAEGEAGESPEAAAEGEAGESPEAAADSEAG